MNAAAIEEILAVLQKHQVPLQHGVSLICKVQSRKLGDLANTCGYHRNSLYKALSGASPAQPLMVHAVERELGVNPWLFAPEHPDF